MLTSLLLLSFPIAQDDTAATNEDTPAQKIHAAWSEDLKAPALHFSASAEWTLLNEEGELAMVAAAYEFESKMLQPRIAGPITAAGFLNYTNYTVQVKTNGDRELTPTWKINYLADGKQILGLNPDNSNQVMNVGEFWANALSQLGGQEPILSFFPLHVWAAMPRGDRANIDFLLDPEIVKIVEDSENHPGELGIESVSEADNVSSMVIWVDKEYRPTSCSMYSDGSKGLLPAPVGAFPDRKVPANRIEMTITNWELIDDPNPDDYKVEIPDGAKVDPKIK